MLPRERSDRVHAALDRAAAARAAKDGPNCLSALREALDLATPDPPLLEKVAWRLSKAAYDFGEITEAFDAITPILADPFRHQPAARSAVPDLCGRWWDTLGYADPRPYRLWQAWIQSYRAEHDPWMAAVGEARLAWGYACSGDLVLLGEIVESTLRLDPRRFGDGPHRHPRAADTPSSVWWAQIEVLRTALWSTAWRPRPAVSADWLDAAEDAAAAAGIAIEEDPWLLDAVLRASLAHGLDVRPERELAWARALEGIAGPRGHLHRWLARGLLAARAERADEAKTAFEQAAMYAREHHLGHEWELDALLRLTEAGSTETLAQARSLAAQFGLGGLLSPSDDRPNVNNASAVTRDGQGRLS